jgi:transposase
LQEVHMLNQERCMEIRILYKQGKSIKAIAQITGHSRNTVRRYVPLRNYRSVLTS